MGRKSGENVISLSNGVHVGLGTVSGGNDVVPLPTASKF